MVSTIDFIRSRELDDQQVSEINFILKARAQRHIAAGREAWLYPERMVKKSWQELRETLRPPMDELHRFGGGRCMPATTAGTFTTKTSSTVPKTTPFPPEGAASIAAEAEGRLRLRVRSSLAGAAGRKSFDLRPSWTERSIRERNLMLFRSSLDFSNSTARTGPKFVVSCLTTRSLRPIAYEGLWPLETDLLGLLPKPDGQLRSVYTGSLHPQHIHEFAIGSTLYFGEILIQHPFVHPGTLNKKLRPTDHPRKYRGEFLKTMLFFMSVMPLVEAGLVNLIPG